MAIGAMGYTDSEVELVARLIGAEARNQSHEGKKAVANVVVNRLDAGSWGDSINRVVYAKNQFANPTRNYTDSEYAAASAVLIDGERVLPDYILYFQRARVKNFHGAWYCTIDDHNFYGKE